MGIPRRVQNTGDTFQIGNLFEQEQSNIAIKNMYEQNKIDLPVFSCQNPLLASFMHFQE